LLEDTEFKTRIFFDYGLCLSRLSEYYSFPMDSPRYSIEEYIDVGLAPGIPEMYDPDAEKPCDAVLISHAHSDHIGATPLLREDIPVFVGDTAFRMFDGAMSVKAKQNLAIKDYQEKNKGRYKTFRTAGILKFNDLRIVPSHVDHSIPRAYAFAAFTSEGVVVYMGDFRRHGVVSHFTDEFLDSIEELGEIKALICEGTHIDGGGVPLSEEDVKNYTLNAIERACKGGLIIASVSASDIDRIRMFWNISKEVERKMVVSQHIAITLISLEKDPRLKDIPEVGKDVQVFERELPITKPSKREGRIIEHAGMDVFLDSKEIQSNAEEYLFLDAWQFTPIRYLNPPSGSIYILSQTEPFEEEIELDYKKLKRWLSVYGIPLYHIHTSGHVRAEEIYRLLKD